jgi:hypothetical protein
MHFLESGGKLYEIPPQPQSSFTIAIECISSLISADVACNVTPLRYTQDLGARVGLVGYLLNITHLDRRW